MSDESKPDPTLGLCWAHGCFEPATHWAMRADGHTVLRCDRCDPHWRLDEPQTHGGNPMSENEKTLGQIYTDTYMDRRYGEEDANEVACQAVAAEGVRRHHSDLPAGDEGLCEAGWEAYRASVGDTLPKLLPWRQLNPVERGHEAKFIAAVLAEHYRRLRETGKGTTLADTIAGAMAIPDLTPQVVADTILALLVADGWLPPDKVVILTTEHAAYEKAVVEEINLNVEETLKLRTEINELRSALGYEVPADTPIGRFKCGMCDAKGLRYAEVKGQLRDANAEAAKRDKENRKLREEMDRLNKELASPNEVARQTGIALTVAIGNTEYYERKLREEKTLREAGLKTLDIGTQTILDLQRQLAEAKEFEGLPVAQWAACARGAEERETKLRHQLADLQSKSAKPEPATAYTDAEIGQGLMNRLNAHNIVWPRWCDLTPNGQRAVTDVIAEVRLMFTARATTMTVEELSRLLRDCWPYTPLHAAKVCFDTLNLRTVPKAEPQPDAAIDNELRSALEMVRCITAHVRHSSKSKDFIRAIAAIDNILRALEIERKSQPDTAGYTIDPPDAAGKTPGEVISAVMYGPDCWQKESPNTRALWERAAQVGGGAAVVELQRKLAEARAAEGKPFGCEVVQCHEDSNGEWVPEPDTTLKECAPDDPESIESAVAEVMQAPDADGKTPGKAVTEHLHDGSWKVTTGTIGADGVETRFAGEENAAEFIGMWQKEVVMLRRKLDEATRNWHAADEASERFRRQTEKAQAKVERLKATIAKVERAARRGAFSGKSLVAGQALIDICAILSCGIPLPETTDVSTKEMETPDGQE